MKTWFSKGLNALGKTTEGADPRGGARDVGVGMSPGLETKTFSALLQTFADTTFDTDASRASVSQKRFLIWSTHVLTGLPLDQLAKVYPRVDEAKGPPRARDFALLAEEFKKHRSDEARYVATSLKELRRLLWAFVSTVSAALSRGREEQRRIEQQVEVLRNAMSSTSTEDLRQATLAAIKLLTQMAEEKKQAQEDQVRQLGTQLEKMRKELFETRRELALDGLTRLYNRKAFDAHLAQTVDLCTLILKPATLLVVDVDRFKAINDTHGHPAGDCVLKALARASLNAFPNKSDFVARYGGEEICVIIHDEPLSKVRELTVRFMMAVRAMEVEWETHALRITVSVGLAVFKPGESADQWLKRADRALYAAKAQGRDRIVED